MLHRLVVRLKNKQTNFKAESKLQRQLRQLEFFQAPYWHARLKSLNS